jgi:KaiC/GvpD/RAD55 family RecA-like ATPase
LPSGATILSGANGSGKTIFSQQYSYEVLHDGGKVLWITTEELPETLRAGMKTFGWNIERQEAEGKFVILDAASPARLGFSENIGHGMLGLDPTGMLIVVTEKLKSARDKNEGFLLVIDSISRLLLSCEPKAVVDFVSCLSSRMENFGMHGLLTVSQDVHEEKLLASLLFSSSGAIRFRINEGGEERNRQLRIEMLRGKKHDDRWKKYNITNSGIDIEI